MVSQTKLKLDEGLIAACRGHARAIASDLQAFIGRHSTVAVERAALRLLGVDGVDAEGVPLVNRVVDAAADGGGLADGVCGPFLAAAEEAGLAPEAAAAAIAAGAVPMRCGTRPKRGADEAAALALGRIDAARARRGAGLQKLGSGPAPLLYVIVASGNIYEDVVQARSAVFNGADIIAVIRSTGQSLLDYVPHGATTEGFGGTFATRANFAIMREALDEAAAEVKRYVRLCNYCSGLCMPEIAALGAVEGLDVMLNDALYGILFRDINPERTFVDQHVSRMINAYAEIIVNTGEDNYLTTADAVEAAHTVLASQFINEQLALCSHMRADQIGLGHAMEINPDIEDGFLMELAQAQMAREIFPGSPLKYMPPTKYMTGNIFKGHVQDALFNLVGVMTGQAIQLLGMMTEAIHTPHIQDRALALENARYVMNNARHLGEEIVFAPGGRIHNRAETVLQETLGLLDSIRRMGIFEALAKGAFADVKRSRNGGRGRDGVFAKGPGYWNPVIELLEHRLAARARPEGEAGQAA